MVDRSRLRQFMIESFNDDELADLVFDYFPNARASLGGTMTPVSYTHLTLPTNREV